MTEIYQEPATPFLQIWQQAGFVKPTPIQQAVYWPLKKGGPVLGLAATGTGKTLAFGLPLLETLQPGQRLQLLILEPSAELVMQVRDVLRPYAQAVGLKIQGIVGKANVKRQQEQLKQHPEIIVATPGRLQEMITNKLVKVDRIETVVIDEADSQLDGEHLNTTRELLATMPADAQMVLMSATEQPIFKDLGKWFGYDFERFDTRQSDREQQKIQHDFMLIGNHQKAELLKRLQRGPIDDQNALVFVKNTGSARTLFKTLNFLNLKVGLLLGDETSQRRQKIMQQFRQKKLTYLITTELAARGLDFPDLKFVVNYDLPQTLVSYTHRAGRTGRMFGTGTVLNLGNEHDHRNLQKTVKVQFHLQTVYLIDGQLTTQKPTQKETKISHPKQVVKHPAKTVVKQEKPRKKKRLRDQKNKGKHRSKAAK